MNLITQVVLPLVLAFIMFSMGLALVIDDFKRVARFPRAFLLGTVLQVIALPLISFTLCSLWPMEPAIAAGFMIIAACPGGVTSNLMTHLARGNTALSISLTAIISILSVITIPFIVNFGMKHFYGADSPTVLPIFKTIAGVFMITTAPVGLGMIIKSKWPTQADQYEPLAQKLASFFFIAIITAAVAKDWALLQRTFSTVGPVALALNIATMVTAMGVAHLFQLSRPDTTAITLEGGLQNGSLAIFISLTLIGNEMMMVPAGVYSLLMFATGGAYLYFCRWREAPQSNWGNNNKISPPHENNTNDLVA